MKKTELKVLRAKKIEELTKIVKEKRLEITKTLAKIGSGQEKNLKKARNLKKDLSQTLTILKEMEIVNKLQKTEEVVKAEKIKEVVKAKKVITK